MVRPPRMRPSAVKVVSGGQTGVDRGALDAALALGLPHGGWVPRGRRAEDGVIPARYVLSELDSADYNLRTRRNVEDSDGTLILTVGEPTGGTALTVRLVRALGKPHLVLDLDADPAPEAVRRWIAQHELEILNVAGPRESKAPGVAARAEAFLRATLA